MELIVFLFIVYLVWVLFVSPKLAANKAKQKHYAKKLKSDRTYAEKNNSVHKHMDGELSCSRLFGHDHKTKDMDKAEAFDEMYHAQDGVFRISSDPLEEGYINLNGHRIRREDAWKY